MLHDFLLPVWIHDERDKSSWKGMFKRDEWKELHEWEELLE